ncbi:hypothetical protein DRQ29_07615, partial [bacterium]
MKTPEGCFVNRNATHDFSRRNAKQRNRRTSALFHREKVDCDEIARQMRYYTSLVKAIVRKGTISSIFSKEQGEIRPVSPLLLHALTRFARSQIILILKITNDKFKAIYKGKKHLSARPINR